jgi:A/G-specific adenine glycosylase
VDAAALLAWFGHAARPLPWRTARRDPYRTWVSEVMLQQTRVETVLRYYDRFLKEFPDVAGLAAAPEDRLMKAWEGMGYYRRARLLQAGARAVVERHGGALPASREALLDLPGFGPYTAGAVGSLAFGLRAPAVDGNVLRVASRLLALEDDVSLPATRRKVEAWVLAHQPAEAPGAFNEALMELGATVCAPAAPRCGACPLAHACEARRLGIQGLLPVKKAKAAVPTVRVAMALVRRGDALLLEKRESGLLAGTWGLPWVEVAEGDDPRRLLARHVESLVGARARVGRHPIKQGRHVFTHRRWEMEAYEVETAGEKGEWRAPGDVALGRAHRRLLDTPDQEA